MGTGIPEGWYLDPGLCGETAFLYPAWWDDILDAWPSIVGLQAETWDQYYEDKEMYHGIARHKGDYEWLEPGQEGIITAYLPEQKTFAVLFSKDKWITFQDFTEEQFLEKFEVLDPPEEENDG